MYPFLQKKIIQYFEESSLLTSQCLCFLTLEHLTVEFLPTAIAVGFSKRAGL